jgi:hypothetical protein
MAAITDRAKAPAFLARFELALQISAANPDFGKLERDAPFQGDFTQPAAAAGAVQVQPVRRTWLHHPRKGGVVCLFTFCLELLGDFLGS